MQARRWAGLGASKLSLKHERVQIDRKGRGGTGGPRIDKGATSSAVEQFEHGAREKPEKGKAG
jgi:hypothetical protein